MPVVCPCCLGTLPQKTNFCGLCGAEIHEAQETIQTYPDPLVGLVVSDRYRVISLLGRGGIGAVYRAEHTAIGKPVALKILHGNLGHRKEVLQRFRREAEAASKLTHIHTVQVFDYGHWRGLSYLVMEYLRGTDLATIIRRDGPMPWHRALSILIQICDSLGEAHQIGIVHRDVKPENVLLVPRAGHPDFVKVVDFGLAKVRDDKSAMETTGDGSLLGTPFYMAPEQIRGEAVDGRTDVYAIGGVLYRCLTGLPPFEAPTPFAVLTRHLSDKLTPPSVRAPDLDIPPGIDAIVVRAMSKSPADRFQTTEEMRRVLTDAVAPDAPLATDVVVVPTPSQVPIVQRPSDLGAPAPAPAPSAPMPPAPDSMPPFPDSVPPSAASPSGLDVAGLSRGEFERYVRHLRRRRRLGWSALVLLLAGGAAAAVLLPPYLKPVPGPLEAEVEPNDGLTNANEIPLGSPVGGTLGRRISPSQGDLDHFRVIVRPLRQWALRADLTGIPGIDLRLDVFGPTGGEPMATADRGGPGDGETVPGVLVDGMVYFVRVSEKMGPGGVPSERLSDEYGVTVTARPATEFEAEPDDERATALELAPGSAMDGYVETPFDRDWFCVAAGAGRVDVRIGPPAGLDLAIEHGAELANAGGPGAAESVSLGRPGDPCLVVRLAPNAGPDGSAAVGPVSAYRIEAVAGAAR